MFRSRKTPRTYIPQSVEPDANRAEAPPPSQKWEELINATMTNDAGTDPTGKRDPRPFDLHLLEPVLGLLGLPEPAGGIIRELAQRDADNRAIAGERADRRTESYNNIADAINNLAVSITTKPAGQLYTVAMPATQ